MSAGVLEWLEWLAVGMPRCLGGRRREFRRIALEFRPNSILATHTSLIFSCKVMICAVEVVIPVLFRRFYACKIPKRIFV